MEFLVINESKLKIIMTPEDTERYEFSAANADYDSPDTRRIFWRIIDEAAGEVGFDPKGDKILIQFYPSRDGGCEIFVTKLGALTASAARLVSRAENVTMLSRESYLYMFSDRSSLLRALKTIPPDKTPKSEVYEAPSGQIILCVEERGGGKISEFPVLGEFATRLPKEMLLYAREHFLKVATESTVEKLSQTVN